MSTSSGATLPEEVRCFRPTCPGCTPATVRMPGARPCSFYECSGLPALLEVTCELCMYDFAAGEGAVKCDHDTCPAARRLGGNVPIYEAWLRLLEEEEAVAARA